MSASSFLRTVPTSFAAALVLCGAAFAGSACADALADDQAVIEPAADAAEINVAGAQANASYESSIEPSRPSAALESQPRGSQIAAFAASATARASLTQPGAGINDAPRLIRSIGPTDSQPSMPGYSSDVSESSYRWWKSHGRADVGLGLGTLTYTSRPIGAAPGFASDNGTMTTTGTVLTLGMRYRTSDHSALYADAAGVRGPGINGDGVVGKVGIEFKSAQSRFNINVGGLGMKLAGDTRMTLRLRRGGLGIFMRRAF
jgi:hypothetical protein